jgi:superfamily II DNA or RNA helicase
MTSDNTEVLSLFQLKGGILVSIKCLDEGVDIPAISHALILASSMNPREFIQRRGRVLRRYPGKTIAKIHDAIITPISLEDEPEQLSLLKSEFIRSYEFSRSAINKMAGHKLFSAATELGINISELIDDGYEEEALNDD